METILEEKFVIEMPEEKKGLKKVRGRSKRLINEAVITLGTLVWDKITGRMGEC